MKSFIKNLIYFVLFLTINFDPFSCKNLVNNFKAFTDEDEIAIIFSDDESELMEAVEVLNSKGGTIYINTPEINLIKNCKINITGELSGGIIGVRQENGEYPRIHFMNKDEKVSGINILGSNKFIEYMIIENAHDNGVSIHGNNNILDHVVSRYNFGSGFVVYGDYNTLNYCYAYRNCDATINSVNADGFRIYGEVNNVFNYCFAWENVNSGFNYAGTSNSSDLSFLHCGSWSNGDISVFTGRYDFELGNVLDKNLWTIQDIIKSDLDFVTNYYNKKFNIDNAEVDGIPINEWGSKVSARIDGNGFTFGNRNSSLTNDVKRYAHYCVAFGNRYGFIDNYNHKYNGYMTNCVAFNNYINYKLPYTFSKWSNNWSWLSNQSDQLNKVKTKEASNAKTLQSVFHSTRHNIVKAINQNMFPDIINYDKQINSLVE